MNPILWVPLRLIDEPVSNAWFVGMSSFPNKALLESLILAQDERWRRA
jgi:hypothetical protein